MAAEDRVEPSTENQDETKAEENTELEKYWKTVRDDPSDFTGWTYLLQYVEQEGNIENGRAAFDAFLERFPYCYGYWKKYSDMEKKSDDPSRVEEVLEAGVMAIPLSIDLWVHYIQYMTSKLKKATDRESLIRRLYERALAAAGTDFRSDKLWDMFIEWERANKLYKNVTEIYDRVLSSPTQLYNQHFENFRGHVEAYHPKDILRLDEFLKLRKEVLAKKTGKEEDDEGENGSDLPPGMAPISADLSSAATHLDDTEVPLLREKIIEVREKLFKANEQEVSKRWTYEEGIRRPYFHVKPLEKNQLRNWRDYLDWEIENGSHECIVVLFERCMIACALYEEFWLKYANYMEAHDLDGVRNIFKRACSVHLKHKPSMHLAWAAFEERNGNIEAAHEILDNLDAQIPGLAVVALRKIGIERRRGNTDDLEGMYNKYVQDTQDKAVKSFFSIKYARFLTKTLGKADQATEVLQKALVSDPDNPKIHLQILDLQFQRQPLDEAMMLDIFQKAIKSKMPLENKVRFSQRRLDFLEDFGSDVTRVSEAYQEHQALLKESQAKKRKMDEAREESEPKKAKVDESSVANGSSDSTQQHTDPNAYYNQWGSYPGYGYQQGGWGGYGGGGGGYYGQ
ncbi:hypothetical protein CAPTEDRAFT_180947 [Capitella teleta]|uniref:Pre-mRNA-processing factor 39 n=1 Tax=Capitella teleta TaxID=283909 RepID=R7UUN7_CAPTE|nr:hypothetical protein CAPTEDRAFT_180947 [Capitella teleta]|eukprot:ELU07632.1 hypothetical protein CAPTEDRAFT_180947 [Capitella teleta]